MAKEMICISCPMGCHLEVSGTIENLVITGNKCARGKIYAQEEISSPKRVVTATIAIKGADGSARIPVKTTAPIPKAKIAPLLNHLYTLEVSSPVRIGEVIIDDFEQTGVGVITTRSL